MAWRSVVIAQVGVAVDGNIRQVGEHPRAAVLAPNFLEEFGRLIDESGRVVEVRKLRMVEHIFEER